MAVEAENFKAQRHASLLSYQEELSTTLSDSRFTSSPYLQESKLSTERLIEELERDPEVLYFLGQMVQTYRIEVELLTEGKELGVVDERVLEEAVQHRTNDPQFQRAVTLFPPIDTESDTEGSDKLRDAGEKEPRGEKNEGKGGAQEIVEENLEEILNSLRIKGPLSLIEMFAEVGIEKPPNYLRHVLSLALQKAGATKTGIKGPVKFFSPSK